MGELISILQSMNLHVHREDIWLWKLEKSNVYSVRSVYNLLTTQYIDVTTAEAQVLWHKDVPMKVVIFTWRLLRDRLPTKNNLSHRGILTNNDSCLCVGRCGSVETLNHLFLHCSVFGAVWYHIYCWLGISSILPYVSKDHFIQFPYGGGGSKVQ